MEGEDSELDASEPGGEPTAAAQQVEEGRADKEPTVALRELSDWHGKDLIDRDGERIGKLGTSTSTSKQTNLSSKTFRTHRCGRPVREKGAPK